jgi:hypothetical protein
MFEHPTRSTRISRWAALCTALLLLIAMLALTLLQATPAGAVLTFPDPAMETVWNRTDKPVQVVVVTRGYSAKHHHAGER